MEFSNSEIKTLASSHFDLEITNNQPLSIFSLCSNPVSVGTQEILLKVSYAKSLEVATQGTPQV